MLLNSSVRRRTKEPAIPRRHAASHRQACPLELVYWADLGFEGLHPEVGWLLPTRFQHLSRRKHVGAQE